MWSHVGMTKHTRIRRNALRSSLPPPFPGSCLAWLGSKKVISLMTRTETAVETLVYSPLNHLTWLLAREYFIEFRCSDSFKLNINRLENELLWFEYLYWCYIHKTSPCNCFISESHTQFHFHVRRDAIHRYKGYLFFFSSLTNTHTYTQIAWDMKWYIFCSFAQ